MKMKKLAVKNIRSYHQQAIEFPEGSLLLAGDVGSGKTTLLLAIEYALFGLQPGQKGSALLRHDAQTGEVLLECEIDGHDIIIERHLKREQRSITSDYAALTLDGETREYSVTELKTKILELLGYPAEFVKRNNLLYRYTVYTPQEQMKQIITEDAETRLNILRHIFGIDKYKRIRENLLLVINRFKEESKILLGEVRSMEQDKTRLALLQTRSKELSVQIAASEKLWYETVTQRKAREAELSDVETKVKEKERLEKEVEKTAVLIALKKESLALLAKEHRELLKAIADAGQLFQQEYYDACMTHLQHTQLELERLHQQHLTVVSTLTSLKKEQHETAAKKERMFKIDICPTCLQDVPPAHKHNILSEAEAKAAELKKQLAVLSEQHAHLQQELERLKAEHTHLEKQKLELEVLRSKTTYIEHSKQKAGEMEKQQETLQKDIAFLHKHIETLKAEIFHLAKFETHYRLKSEELKKAFLVEKNAEIAIAELKKEQEMTHRDITRIEQDIAQKEERERTLKRLITIIDWLSTHFTSLINFTEIQVLMKLRREFSRVFSTWFHMIAGDVFEVKLDENFTPVIMQGEFEMDYAFLSGGERTAVALAYRLALNQTINSVLSQIKTRDIVILDEPTEGFSEAQIDKIRDVLEQLAVSQLIIVSHEQKIESFVDSIIRLRKAGDVSEVETAAPAVTQPIIMESAPRDA